jgi:tetratricopeptide (TPR) repeat protein
VSAEPPRSERWPAVAVLALVAAVYLVSLSGDWVWDDVYQLRDNPAIVQPLLLVTRDVWSPTGFADARNTPVYRPLAMLSHVPGQRSWRGPAPERVLGLALHLAAVALVAALAGALGLSRRAAWFGAACFGLHPGGSEAVAWISARADLLGAVLVLGGMLALVRGRDVTAGLLVALAPFCKEAFVLAPLSLWIWALALRRRAPLALALAACGVAGYFAARFACGIALPGSGPVADARGATEAVGALALRGIELVLAPRAPEVFSPYAGNLAAGLGALAGAVPALIWLPGRPWLAGLLAPLPILALAAPASLANGFVADRYFYAALAGVGVAAACGYAALEHRARLAPALFVLPLLLAPFATLRARDWTSNERLFAAAVARRPQSAEALFHLAYAHHKGDGGCAAALPLYARAMAESRRAGNNLQACLMEAGRLQEAARLGPRLAERDEDNPTPALNTARALSLLGDQAGAERWAREAIRRGPQRARGFVLLGNVLGLQERYAEALDAFARALALAPELDEARRGRALAERRLEAES